MAILKEVLRRIPGLTISYNHLRFFTELMKQAYTITPDRMNAAHLKDEFNSDLPVEHRWYNHVLTVVAQQLGMNPWGDTLEVGCSEGVFTNALAQRCSSVTAYDVSVVAKGRAAQRCASYGHVQVGLLNIVTGEITGQYDLVFAMDVLYYVNGRSRLIDVVFKLANAVRYGGLLVLTDCRVGPEMRSRWWRQWLPKGADDYLNLIDGRFGLHCVHREEYPANGVVIPGYPDKLIAIFEKRR